MFEALPSAERALPLLCAMLGPFLLTSAVAGLQSALVSARARGVPPPGPLAGDWLREVRARFALPVDIGVQPELLVLGDGYWPGARYVALTRTTWRRRGVVPLAIAAHELGHAIAALEHRLVDRGAPVVRTVAALAWQAFLAAFALGALRASEPLLEGALVALVVSAAASVLVVADEAIASRIAYGLLRSDRRFSSDALALARDALWGALSVYGALALGRAVILACWPVVHAAALDAPPPPIEALDGLARLVLLVASPVLVLHVARTLLAILVPEAPASEFRLASLLFENARWDALAGLLVAALVATGHTSGASPTFLLLAALAATPAVAPVAAMGRIPLLIPIFLVSRWWGSDERDGAPPDLARTARLPSPERSPLLDLYANTTLSQRAVGLAAIAYLPFWALLLLRAAVS